MRQGFDSRSAVLIRRLPRIGIEVRSCEPIDHAVVHRNEEFPWPNRCPDARGEPRLAAPGTHDYELVGLDTKPSRIVGVDLHIRVGAMKLREDR